MDSNYSGMTYMAMSSVPNIVRRGAEGTSVISLDDALMENRAVVINEEITSETATTFFKVVNHLTKKREPIKVYIYSSGGSVTAGKAIYDIMQSCGVEVHTYCIGAAASMAAILLAAGTKGHRYILPHAEVMIHEVLVPGGVGGSATNIRKISESIDATKQVMNGILAKHTGKSIEEIDEATSYDHFMTAEEAIEFGICDHIIESL
ncbi:MAG: ATP-dependent Clp protease proteolytic subunit [Lachnospiraceae bacterium]|nr:ATP-dependent Clp protease proteolytic subunit [Lachnospiraceae bacterium]